MRDRSSNNKKPKQDINQIAKSIVDQATGENPVDKPTKDDGKNPAAVMLGRLGGLKGGKARAAKLSAEERSGIARRAAMARWATGTGDET